MRVRVPVVAVGCTVWDQAPVWLHGMGPRTPSATRMQTGPCLQGDVGPDVLDVVGYEGLTRAEAASNTFVLGILHFPPPPPACVLLV